MTIQTMDDLMIEELRDLYHAEKQLTKALPKMAKAAHSPELKAAFEGHLKETAEHVKRLESVFTLLGKTAKAKTCEAMEGLVKEGTEAIEEDIAVELRDCALIAAAQKVEHYEISGYGTLRAWATQLGHEKVAALLEQTENEEKAADHKLTQICRMLIKQHSPRHMAAVR